MLHLHVPNWNNWNPSSRISEVATSYEEFFESLRVDFVREPEHAKSNFKLDSILFQDHNARDRFFGISNSAEVKTRPK